MPQQFRGYGVTIYKKRQRQAEFHFLTQQAGSGERISDETKHIFVCVFFALVLTGISSAADKVWCPDTIKVDQKAIPPSPAWSVSYNSLPYQLEMVTFFSGSPQGNASLVYDEKSKINGGWVGTWYFPRDSGGYWIRCSYGGTRAELSRRLPNTVSACRVTYDDGSRFPSGLPVIQKIECQ